MSAKTCSPFTKRRLPGGCASWHAVLPLLLALFLDPTLAAARDLDLATLFDGRTFRAQLPAAIRWLDAGEGYACIASDEAGQAVERIAPDDGSVLERVALDGLAGLPADFELSDFRWHVARGVLLLRGALQTDWMGYASAPWYLHVRGEDTVRPIGASGDLLELLKLSPDGRHVGFVRENDLYLVDLDSGRQWAVSEDGDADIFNGVFDYGSTEFGPRDGWRWSPSGTHLAFWRMDATDVPYYPLIDELHGYSQVRRFHYPNTGEVHAVNEVRVYDLASGSTTTLPIGQDPDDYLPKIHFSAAADALYVQHLSRDHKTLRLWRTPLDGTKPELLLTDRDPAWIDVGDDLRSLADGSILWTSEKRGYRHIYRVAADGTERPLTAGDWSVDAIVGVDAADGWVYFYAKKDSLVDQFVYRVRLSGGEPERLTQRPGWHRWDLSPDGRRALATHSDANTPPSLSLRRGDGEVLRTIVADSVPALAEYDVSDTEFVTFTVEDGIELNAFMIRPPDFDPSRRYPVIAYGYGNAGSQVVVNRWGTQRGATQDLWHRYLAQEGYVVFAMDNRTTAGRGKAAKNLTYGEYGKYAVRDYVEGVDYLESLPWVDGDRIGFWGWSGGGYLAAALMTKAAPLFKVAVSVAPVIDLTRYQAVGVERWMGTPEENPGGYAAVNLMNFADRLQGKLLLIHGTGDENVKFAFTLQFADALIRANKQFDMLLYPNQRHGIEDFRQHVFTTMTRYFDENL